ncbi:MAG: hypothetical protein AVDCRST_MAG59-4197, partial [uncultured Thermomicrobiales bacterium]
AAHPRRRRARHRRPAGGRLRRRRQLPRRPPPGHPAARVLRRRGGGRRSRRRHDGPVLAPSRRSDAAGRGAAGRAGAWAAAHRDRPHHGHGDALRRRPGPRRQPGPDRDAPAPIARPRRLGRAAARAPPARPALRRRAGPARPLRPRPRRQGKSGGTGPGL